MKLPQLPLQHQADLILAGTVSAIVATLIVPLPPWLLDALLALNLGLGATLLAAALHAREALKLASFPTLLLITTLFRLSLNVASTRLALVEAHAGDVIQAFGEFVIQGDYVVGAVVFAILALVQFLVVAKGAERVAEVGARFTLDAMPGKQMAIDADLRAGAIDQECARARRRALERENQLYGAMDGAMKFVKGDAIAGLVVVLVNSLGGLVVGVAFKGMTASEAARTYTLLAIGDGLVSQIPALCIAISAGLVVTRVAGDEAQTSLGLDIARQFLARPRALAVVSVLLALLGLMPLMPKLPFFGLAAASAGAGLWLSRREKAAPVPETSAEEASSGGDLPTASVGALAAGVTPIRLFLDASLAPVIRASEGRWITQDLPALREILFAETGVRFPPVSAQLSATAVLGHGVYEIALDEVPCARARVEPSACYTTAGSTELSTLGIAAEPATAAGDEAALSIVSAADCERLRAAGIPVRDAGGQVLAHLGALLRRHASLFLGIQEVQHLLEPLEKSHPALVREAGQKVALPLLAEVLRRLVDEGVSVRNLRAILEALCEPGADGDAIALAERCRRALRRHLSHRYAGEGTLYAHLADPELEEILREAIRLAPEPGALALAPDDAVAILEGVGSAIGEQPEAIILTAPDVRRYLRKLCEGRFPTLAVLTYGELTPELQIRPMGKICPARSGALA